MTNEEIRAFLQCHAEPDYQKFSAGLIPGGQPMFGVRIPLLRKLAGQIAKGDWQGYLRAADGTFFEEVMLQGLVIGYARAKIEEILPFAAEFIPKIKDWSVNDTFCGTFKIARKCRAQVWDFLMRYREMPEEFPQRMVAVMLMDHFLVEEYIERVFLVWDSLQHEGYYRKMGVAWGIATAYAKFPAQTHAFLLDNHLDKSTCHYAIRKMLESDRITPEQKETLRAMKAGAV